jgi:undecaprenyl phosphate-alpha-L-ara4FN deformylase
MHEIELYLKIDVDTERGTAIGIPNLLNLFSSLNVKATFLPALGPDNTGRAIRRIFKPGFFQKVQRTSALSVYGLRTLLNGVLLPGPHIGAKHQSLLKSIQEQGHEVGIHCYDHVYWHDKLHTMGEPKIRHEINKAVSVFKNIFNSAPSTMGAAGWQANKSSLIAYDELNLLYASDTRGSQAFFPTVGIKKFKTLQIPTTLPTLDELLGRPEFPLEKMNDFYLGEIKKNQLNVFTLHAELEGMKYIEWFESFLKECIARHVTLGPLENAAKSLLQNVENIPHLPLIQGEVEGRAGNLAKHG